MKLILTQALTTEPQYGGNRSTLTIFKRSHQLELTVQMVVSIANKNIIVIDGKHIKLTGDVYDTDFDTLNASSISHIRHKDAGLEYYQHLLDAGWKPENQVVARGFGYPDIPIL